MFVMFVIVIESLTCLLLGLNVCFLSLALRRPQTCSLSTKLHWLVLRHWRKCVIIPRVFVFLMHFDWGTLTVPVWSSSFFVRDRPNLFYFNFLKCATAFNVMAASLNGLQCPTTQVERTWLCFPRLLVFPSVQETLCSVLTGVCKDLSWLLLGVIIIYKAPVRGFQPKPLCSIY